MSSYRPGLYLTFFDRKNVYAGTGSLVVFMHDL